MTVVLEKQNGSQLVWLWQDNGQEIELTYSDGYFQLSYQNITDLNNTPHSSFFGDFEITNPDESVTIGDSYFRFNLITYGGTYASQEWVEADVASAIPSSYSSISDANGNVITASGAVTWQVPTYRWALFLGWSIGLDQPEETIYMSGTKTDSVGFSNYGGGSWKYTLTFSSPSTWTLKKFSYSGSWEEIGTWTDSRSEGATFLQFSEYPEQCTLSWGSSPVATQDTLATKSELPSKTSDLLNDSGFITASAIPSNVGAFTNDVGYLTASSSAFVAKRDKTDMSAVVGTTYASWNLSALHSTTYSPALELKWGTYNVFGEEQECWLVDDEYRQVCFFLLPELNMLYWGVRNQDNSYIAGYGETITLSSDELSIATINGVAEITCTRTSKEGSPEVSTIATMKDLQGFQNINEKRDWWDNTTPASVDATGKFTINNFSVMVGSSSYVLDQFSKSGSTSTWKTTSGDYPNITTTDGLNFTLNYDSSTTAYFTMGELKPGPAKGTIGGSNFNVYANFKLTTFALKDWVDANLNVSGIGCSTVTMSGIYSDLTSFSYNVVVQ